MDVEFDDDVDPATAEGITKGIAHDHFAEVDEVNELVDNIPNAVNDVASKEMSDEKFTEIVDMYLEQPHLLDPHLDSLLKKLLAYVQDRTTPVNQFHCAFKYIYLLTKVRGHKIMIRKFPHEVSDLEPVLDMLGKQSVHDQETWETRYMLLLWLSMICLIPFDMTRFDVPGAGENTQSVTCRILDFGKLYLTMSSDSCQEAAVLLLSKFVTRPDIYKDQLPLLLNWCVQKVKNNDPQLMVGLTQIKGSLSVMAMVFKQGKRDDLLPFCTRILEQVQLCNLHQVNNTVLRKLNTKLVQRLGMTLLKPKVAAWRYKRGNRSLDDTLRLTSVPKAEPVIDEVEEDEDYNIPDDVETVLEIVLNGLKDKDTVVRWSAAKGVGRITGRLPKELANEIVDSVLENFSMAQSDGAWHGGCLALAELGRRGLLLPECLTKVVPILLKALTYDERRGASSVGSHVRDAACYLAWSFARAYSADTLKKYVKEIAETLLVTTVFDREVNCRRAASAAFQENVGRQGHFPHGIAILTIADYFAVSNRSNTYLKISPAVGRYKAYTTALINNLVTQKRDHWDNSIRWLTAQSMHKLTKLKPDYVSTSVLSQLVPLCTGMDLITRHGSILIVAEIVHSLHELEETNGNVGLLSRNPNLKGIFRVVKQLSDSKLFRGSGGELMRVAACHLIYRISQCSETITVPKLHIDQWTDLLHETLSNLHTYTNTDEICNTAVNALSAINQVSLTSDPFKAISTTNPEEPVEAVDQYLSYLSSNVERKRCGYAQAIASLPKPILQKCFMKVCCGLIEATKVHDSTDTPFAESRRDAVQALARVCCTVGICSENNPNSGVCQGNVDLLITAILDAMGDYTRDKRGDIGSEVRKAAVKAITKITVLLATDSSTFISTENLIKIMCSLLQQACEKIHKVRDLAAEAFVTILHNRHIKNISCKKELCAVFPDKTTSFSMIHLFDRMAKLLNLHVYSYHILLGLVVSVGDLTQSLAEASSVALFSYMDSIREDSAALNRFCTDLLSVFEKHIKKDRISVPLLKTVNLLLIQDCFSLLVDKDTSFPADLLALAKLEISKSRDAQKLLVSINVFCGMLQFKQKDFRKAVLAQLMIMLCHRFPVVRRTTASQLYEVILTYDDLCQPDEMDTVITTLSDTEWDQPVDDLRPLRNSLCSMFGVNVPRLVKKPF